MQKEKVEITDKDITIISSSFLKPIKTKNKPVDPMTGEFVNKMFLLGLYMIDSLKRHGGVDQIELLTATGEVVRTLGFAEGGVQLGGSADKVWFNFFFEDTAEVSYTFKKVRIYGYSVSTISTTSSGFSGTWNTTKTLRVEHEFSQEYTKPSDKNLRVMLNIGVQGCI